MSTFDLVPELGQRMRSGRRVEKFVGTADLPNYFHKPYGPGWALVGDAGRGADAGILLAPESVQDHWVKRYDEDHGPPAFIQRAEAKANCGECTSLRNETSWQGSVIQGEDNE